MNKTWVKNHKNVTKHAGFTLLELVLVLFLLSLMASATLFLTENVDSQAKYDETKRRMEIIRQAIVGDPTRRLNGQTEISGFAADMGRLPSCLAELLEVSGAIASTNPQQFDSPCGVSAPNLTEWHIDSSTGIYSGWRGPYIRVSPESDGEPRFRDGYRNSDNSDQMNSGWLFVNASDAISLTSIGPDSILGTTDDVIDTQLVTSSDWAINTLSVSVLNQSASDALPTNPIVLPESLSLVIFLTDTSNVLISNDAIEISTGQIHSKDTQNFTFTFNSGVTIPIGTHGYILACDSDSSFDGSELIFDRTGCTTSISYPDSIKSFTVAPRQNPNLNWTIQ